MASGKKAAEKKAVHNKAGHEKKEVHAKKEAHAGHAGHAHEKAGHEAHGHAKAEAAHAHGHEKAHAAKEGKVEVKQEKAVKKVFEKKVPVKISKSREVKRLSRLVLAKARPMFRGRFGQRAVRNVGDAKWRRWRKPRGIDIYFRREDGLVPGTGYQRPKEIRFVHPSGYRERLVCNLAQLLAL